MELQIRFKTDRFRLSGPLPEAINAGNQFYGEDVARWLCESLPQWKLGFMDEDWGWLVFSRRDAGPPRERHMVCVYAYPPEDRARDDGEWMLSLSTERRRPWLSFLWKSVPHNRQLASDVLAALRTVNARDLETTES